MAFDPKFKYYLIDPDTGLTYAADPIDTGGYNVYLSSEEKRLNALPMGWDKLNIKWTRHPMYMGCFRKSSTDLIFSEDGRAILSYLSSQTFSQAQCILRIDMLFSTATGWGYRTVYKCYINFESCTDNLQTLLFTAGTLDGGLYSRLELNGDTDVQIPFWESDGGGGFTTDAIFVQDRGIKLLYDARFVSGATVDNSVALLVNAFVGSGPSVPGHSTPSLVNSQLIPYIGNEILASQLIIGTQSFFVASGSAGTGYNNYSNKSYVLHCLLPNGPSGTAVDNIKYLINATISNLSYLNPPAGIQRFYRFEIAEVDSSDTLTDELLLLDIEMSNDSSFADNFVMFTGPITIESDVSAGLYNRGTSANPLVTFNVWTPFSLKYDRVYALSVRAISSSPGDVAIGGMTATFTNLVVDFTSQSIAGLADTDLRFPESHYIAFRPHQVLEKVVPRLNSTSTTPTGFAIVPSGTPFVGRSDYLSDPAQTLADNFDNIPYQTPITSGNALRLNPGQTYLTTSVSSVFKMCFGIWGCGMGIENDSSGEPNVIRIEPMQYFFDKDTLLFDLGADIYGLETMPLIEYLGGNLKAGYATKWRDFSSYIGTSLSYYGIDAVNFEQDYKMPFFTGEKKSLDWIVEQIAEMYVKESARASQNTTTQNSNNSNNDNYLIEIEAEATVPIEAREPGGIVVPTTAYYTTAYPTINTTSPFSPPYARGYLFPETAQNMGLTPGKNVRRNGAFLHAICGGLDDRNIMFQKQYWQLLNGNVSLTVAGVATNLNSGLITEVEDIAVSDLADPLFIPQLVRFSTRQPINMYEIMNTNTNGYIQFTYNKKVGYGNITVKGFIWDVSQNLGTEAATEFTLLLHPDTDLAILRA